MLQKYNILLKKLYQILFFIFASSFFKKTMQKKVLLLNNFKFAANFHNNLDFYNNHNQK